MSISRFAPSKHEMDNHAEVAVPEEEDNIFKAVQSSIVLCHKQLS